jgi:dolichol-phosphate mannosyltransferase
VFQGAAAVILLWRLLPGMRRVPPVVPRPDTDVAGTSVSVIVPTLNEVARLGPCLTGLARQGEVLREVLVVDSGSTDGTQDLVREAGRKDPRVQLLHDPPLPAGWIGKVWALQHGLSFARGDWVLGVDADTEANEGMVAGVVAAAQKHDLELVSFGPKFAGQSPWERWLQPALLITLVYRTGAPSPNPRTGQLLANGQCFLVRRDVLLAHGGYEAGRASFADDVRLARHYAEAGVRCGFLDGRLLYRVRAYRSAREMWREWGRSVDLSDVTSRFRQWLDVGMLVLVQAVPLPFVVASVMTTVPRNLAILNGGLLAIRLAMLAALAPSYERRGVPWFLSWLADIPAVFRVAWSTVRRPVNWRGRVYRDLA